jgi:hypothetical protein
MIRSRSVLALAGAIVLAGCNGLAGATDPAPAHDRAHAVLSGWAKAVAAAGGGSRVTPVGELTGQIGDWEPEIGDNNKIALMAGMVASVDALSAERPADGEVRWEDGTTTLVPLVSPEEALAGVRSVAAGSGPCSDCNGLLVMGARLTSGPIQTTRGPAMAPVWEFAIQGTDVKVTRVAIADPVVVVPSLDWAPQLGLAINSAAGSQAGNELTVAFVGAPNTADKECGEDYTAEAVESDLAVVVIVTRHPHFAPLGGTCSAVGARRTASVTMAAPLGERAVLDLQLGTPVPVELVP